MRRAAITTVAAGIAKAVALLTSLVSIPLTFRYLGPERYGIWMVLTSIIAAMGFADLGIGNGLMNAISEAYGKDNHRLAKEYVTSALALLISIAVLLALIGAVAFPFLPWTRILNVQSAAAAREGSWAFVVLYASFLLSIPLGVITRVQAGFQEGYTSQVITAVGSALSLLAILIVIGLHGSLFWLVFASVFAGICANIFNGLLLYRSYPWLLPSPDAFRKASATKILRLGMMFFILQCSYTLAFTSDNIVIAQILGAAAVAAYAVPQKLFSSIAMIVNMAMNPLWPAYSEAIARGDTGWVKRTFYRSLWTVLGITVPCFALLVVSGPWILKVAVGKSLHAPLALLIALACWGVIGSLSTVASVLLNGAGIMKEQTVLAIVVGVSNLGLSIYLTRHFGVIGVCLGSVIVQLIIVFPTYFVIFHKFFKALTGNGGKWNSTNPEPGTLALQQFGDVI